MKYKLKVAEGAWAVVSAKEVVGTRGPQMEVSGVCPRGNLIGIQGGSQRQCENYLRESIREDLFKEFGFLAGLCWSISRWGAKAYNRDTTDMTVENFALKIHPGKLVSYHKETAREAMETAREAMEAMVKAELARWEGLQCPDRHGDVHILKLTSNGQTLANTVQKVIQLMNVHPALPATFNNGKKEEAHV